MQNHIYKIDESRFDELKRRMFVYGLKRLGVPFILPIILEYYVLRKQDFPIIPFIIIMLIVMAGVFYVGYSRSLKAAKTFVVQIDDNSIEAKAEMAPYKKIYWTNMIVNQKTDGSIQLFDNNVSSFMRKMYGNGLITIPPEIENRDELLLEISSKSSTVLK